MSARQETWGERALRELLGSEARAKILAWICSQPASTPIVGASLARELHLAPNAVWIELERLERLGMLEAGDKLGRAKPYYVNERFPLLPGLRSMVSYATGIVAALRDRLGHDEDIDAAFIFGSVAAGDDRSDSDVDLLVVGDIVGARLSQLMREAEQATGREINQVQYSAREFATRLREGGSFLDSAMANPKIFIKGDEDALRALAE